MDTTSVVHVVALPYPDRGHINPMMKLCKLLASSDENLLITFVVMEEWLGSYMPPNIRLLSIPNVIPSEQVPGDDFLGFIEVACTKMEEPFQGMLERHELNVGCIMANTYMQWAVLVGKRWNIAVPSLWTMSPSVLSIYYHFDLLSSHGHLPFHD
ncbi:UDP-glycosyltransferase 87A1 [Cinnamomum micranthum f. kanehirae]|uniref:UDP-glycosyltransferase 87A1 n=1 Tax=Cinnamomum micranthum f. kanehirae TaxID=337451 RepID=A0A3S3NAY4_9MAGN|nr:UDP-glycosyltransferase 87A1 [Cinnamomum micranthum f. kanehirae]